ncbi:hypothetical protein MFUM_1020028 [Methylacidiphilum fumariolicum SolV]|uniref:Uncharacterized protein n=2 Tax=Candidatus Methylacidiphilum fumarolicum TaxID=591154 RepID=I0JVN6_METFB|nr:hypothetical protein MFUM_1020028 [Methylacidiphilum fumariolicum SolV]
MRSIPSITTGRTRSVTIPGSAFWMRNLLEGGMGGHGLSLRGAQDALASLGDPLGQTLSKRTTADRALLSDSPRVDALLQKIDLLSLFASPPR